MEEEKSSTTTPAQNESKPQASVSKPQAKSSNSKVIIIIVVVLVVLGGVGYAVSRYLAKKAGEVTAEKILESSLGGNVDISDDGASYSDESGSVSTGSNAKWPTDMPSGVPEFKYGTVIYAASSNTDYKSWSVSCDKVTDNAFTLYKKELTDKGWAESSTSTYGTVSTSGMSKDNLAINFSVDTSQKNATIIVNYNE
jgi:hypothetical protein